MSGAPPEVIEQYQSTATDTEFVVLPENWVAVTWFLEIDDCWRWRSAKECIGLDWMQVEAEARLRAFTFEQDDFKKLKTIANEARRLINERLNAG